MSEVFSDASILLSEFVKYASESQRLVRNGILAKHELSPREFFVLRTMKAERRLLFRELVTRLDFGINSDNLTLGIDEVTNKSTISQAVGRLVERLLAKKDINTEDRRQPFVLCTAQGEKLLHEVEDAENQVVETLLSNGLRLTDADTKKLGSILRVGMQTMSKIKHTGRANRARVYDYLLGGDHYMPVDEVAAKRFLEKWPDYKMAARANRAFQRRACFFLTKQEGIKQFVDIGAGLPTTRSTHDVVSGCPVLYVDNDPDVVAIAQYCLNQSNPPENVRYIQGDVCDPDSILWNKEFRQIIDLSKPVGVILGAVLHYVLDEKKGITSIKTLAGRFAPGSCFVASHATFVNPEKGTERVKSSADYEKLVSPTKPRTPKDFQSLFEGMTLIGGLDKPVYAPEWHPEINDDVYKPNEAPLTNQPWRSRCLVGVFQSGKITE